MVSRVRFLLGQLGVKPEARQALARLLDAPDLEAALLGGSPERDRGQDGERQPRDGQDPQRWRRLDQRTWRTGAVAKPQPWQAAARALGSVTAWRSFQAGPQPQWLWLQWAPMASTAGAAEALAAVEDPAFSVRNLRAKIETVERRTLQPPPAVSGADRVTATEEHTTGPDLVLTLRCIAGRHLVLLCASGEGSDWSALVTLAELQLRRLSMM